MKILEFLPIFLEWNQSGKRCKYDYERAIQRLVLKIGNVELDLVESLIHSYFSSIRSLDATTYNNYKRQLSVFFNTAKRRGLIKVNPCDLVPTRRPVTEEGGLIDEHEIKTIPKELLDTILSNIKQNEQDCYALPILLLAETGARPIEVCRLRKSQFDYSKRQVYFKVTKTGSPRYAFISQELAEAIHNFSKNSFGEFLFPRFTGGMTKTDYLTKIWGRNVYGYRIFDNPGEPIKLYWLRHTKAVEIFSNPDIPLPIAAKMLGMSIATANRYFGFTRDHSREAWALVHHQGQTS